jgi:hypothetical protein
VLRGSVEVFATKVLRARPLEVVTPTAVVGVRGTRFRVGFDEAANSASRVEVVEGEVHFDAATRSTGTDVPAGFGSATDAAGIPPRVVKLLDAPDLSTLPTRFERPLVRFALPAETTALRVQLAADAAFDRIVVDPAWAPNVEAPRVRFQVADDATFTRLVHDRAGLANAALRVDIAAPGRYVWRLANLRATGDKGPVR